MTRVAGSDRRGRRVRPWRMPGRSPLAARLQSGEEAIGYAEEVGQAQAGVGGDAAVPVDNGASPGLPHTDCLRDCVVADLQWIQELLAQDLAWTHRRRNRLFSLVHDTVPSGARRSRFRRPGKVVRSNPCSATAGKHHDSPYFG